MLAKLMTMLAATKGASVAAVVVLGAATVTVGASSPEIQDTVKQVVETVTGQTIETSDTPRGFNDACGQPIVVAQRNAATKLIDGAFQSHHKALEDLRSKGADAKAASDLLKTADDELKDLRTKALNDVAALTLGREGQNTTGGSPKPSRSPKPSASPCSSAGTAAADSPKADRTTTLDADIKAIADKALADMDAVVTGAQSTVGALLPADHGKPADNPSEDHKPSGSPKH